MVDVQTPGDKRSPKILLGTTPNGKEIYLVRKPNKSVRFIEFGTGGQLPVMLSGGFSDRTIAQGIVNSYLAKLAAKEEEEEPEDKKKGRGSKS